MPELQKSRRPRRHRAIPSARAASPSSAFPAYLFGRTDFPSSNFGLLTAVADLNGDGRLDLVSRSFSNNITVLLGQPDGGMTESGTFDVPEPGRSAAIVDFNRDGHPDIAIVATTGVSVLLGNGDGTFQPQTLYLAGGVPIGVVAGDFNGDGIQDLAVAASTDPSQSGSPGVASVLLGNGDGTFQTHIDSPAGIGVTRIVTADFDHDGAQDLTVVNLPTLASSTVSLLLGRADGTFQPPQDLSVAGAPLDAAIGDFDKDGNPDLVVVTGLFANGEGVVSVLFGVGDGTFRTRVDLSVPVGPEFVAVTDLNHDGNPDLVFESGIALSVDVLLGNGDGTFQPYTEYLSGLANELFAGDFDGDGNTDIAIRHDLSNATVLLGNGDGTLPATDDYDTPLGPDWAVAGDFNNDGLPDLAVSNQTCGGCPCPNSTMTVYLAQGEGVFQPGVSYLTGGAPFTIATGDLNGDRYLDLVTSSACDGGVSVFLNQGNGTFSVKVDYSAGGPDGIEVRDFNSDGIQDLAVTNIAEDSVSILLGQGDGTFKPRVDYPTGPGPAGIVAADLNGDGKLDLAVADLATPQGFGDTGKVSLLLGAGDGTFTPGEIDTGQTLTPVNLTAADFNRDGTPDLAVVMNRNAIGLVAVLQGNGDATFSLTSQINVGRISFHVVATDFDGDGETDLAVTEFFGARVRVFKGKGDGNFDAKATIGARSPFGIAVADFNRDNAPDIAFTSWNNATFSTLNSQVPAVADFTLTVAPPTATIPPVGAAPISYTLTVTSRNGFSGTVNLTCGGAPTNSTCSVSPDHVDLTTVLSQTVTITVGPVAPARLATTRLGSTGWGGLLLAAAALGFAFQGSGRRTHRAQQASAMLLLLCAAVLLLPSCGSSAVSPPPPPPPPTPMPIPVGTYSLTVQGTSGVLQHGTEVSLMVKH